MDLLMFWVWIGGMFGMEGRKIGFFKRIAWPLYLGEMIAAKVFEKE